MQSGLLYRKLGEDGDMLLGQGQGGFVTGVEAMQQSIETRLKTFRGEWWEEDPTALPVMTEILGLPQTERNREMIDLLVIARIMDTVGVVSVEEARSEYRSGRRYCFSCKVNTVYGQTKVEVAF